MSNSPYPGNTYNTVPMASQLTGAEIMPLMQSGRNRYTTASNLASLVSGGGSSGGIAQISTGSGLTGGPITSSGTLSVDIGNGLAFSGNTIVTSGYINFSSLQSASPSILIGNPTSIAATPSEITLGANLAFSGTTLVTTGLAGGTLTQISTGTGLTGGPVTSSGTISFASIAPSALWANVSTATSVPVVTTLGAGLAFSGTTIVNTSGIADGVLQISTGTGLTGGPITSSGTVQFSTIAPSSLWANVSTATNTPVVITLAGNLAFSGTTLTTTNLTTGTVTQVATGTGLTGGTITNTGTVSFASIATKAFWANVSTATAVPVVTTLAGNLAFSGTTLTTTNLSTGTVGSISTGTGLTGGTITNTGTIQFAQIAPSSMWANVSTATNTPVVITLAGNLAFSGTTLTTTNLSTGTVGSIATGTGLTGGTITNTGTISFASIAPTSLWTNISTATAVPVVTTLGAGLAFSGSTIITTGTGNGTVTNIITGTGLTGGPITATGTISFAQIAPSSLWANVSTATTTPVVTTLGGGLAFSGTTIINTSGAASGVTSIVFQSGLSGGTITSTGTVGISNNGVTNFMIRQGAPSTIIGNPSTITANVQDITIAGPMTMTGTTLYGFCMNVFTQCGGF